MKPKSYIGKFSESIAQERSKFKKKNYLINETSIFYFRFIFFSKNEIKIVTQ